MDVNGVSVPTYYSWDAGMLTQHVDLSVPGINFPVVADPAWGYTVAYKLKKKPKANKDLLKKCFNCYFPVNGAPKKYPAIGQLLPLKVWKGNFECIYRREFSSTGYFGFQFDATKNHIDGLGSNISFEFLKSGNDTYLFVSAYILRLGEFSVPYMNEATKKWKTFATNLNKA